MGEFQVFPIDPSRHPRLACAGAAAGPGLSHAFRLQRSVDSISGAAPAHIGKAFE